jgi:hypothetical protein
MIPKVNVRRARLGRIHGPFGQASAYHWDPSSKHIVSTHDGNRENEQETPEIKNAANRPFQLSAGTRGNGPIGNS